MSALTTARPYAAALFAMAKQRNNVHDVSEWLLALSSLMSNDEVVTFLAHPNVTAVQQVDFLNAACMNALPSEALNLLKLLSDNQRLNQLKQIESVYHEHVNVNDNTVDVTVTSSTPLEGDAQARLTKKLEARLGQKITMNTVVEKEQLLGGARIEVGDKVINGSLRYRLNELAKQINT